MTVKKQLVLVAGGLGTRLGHAQPKALVSLDSVPLLVRTLNSFQSENLVNGAIVVYPQEFRLEFSEVLESHFSDETIHLVAGGEERFDSVARGLGQLANNTELVVIHDAARPFIQGVTIRDAIEAAVDTGASTVAIPCKDTIIRSDSERILESTPDRSTLWACQTPQIFRRDIIEKAYSMKIPKTITDDASLVNQSGVPVQIVVGSDMNLKITTPQDLEYAEYLLSKGKI